VPVEELRRYEEELYRYLETQAPRVLAGIADKKIIDDEIKGALEAALTEFGKQFIGTIAAVALRDECRL
jgi:F-type H+-transporting ATPase subunit alpha